MDANEQIIYRLELQVGQLIRLVANLNERVERLEEERENRRTVRVFHMKPPRRVGQ